MIRAFVSSICLDLIGHRAYVIAKLMAIGIFVDPMEKWTAASDEPKELFMARVKECHLRVLMSFASVAKAAGGLHLLLTAVTPQVSGDPNLLGGAVTAAAVSTWQRWDHANKSWADGPQWKCWGESKPSYSLK